MCLCRDVMDVVFSVCIVRCGAVGALLDGYISANQEFIFTFLSKITKYNRIHLEAIPRSFARP